MSEGSEHGVVTAKGQKDYKETKNWLINKGETIVVDLEFKNKKDLHKYLQIEEQ